MDRAFSSFGTASPGRADAGDYRIAPQPADMAAWRMQRWLRIILLGAAFLATWRVFRWGWTNLTASDALLMLAGLALLAKGRLTARPFGQLSSPWLWGFAAMTGGLLLGTLVNGEPLRWIIGSSQYFFALIFVPMVFASLDRQLLLQCMKAFVLGVALSQVIGIIAAQFFDYQDTYLTVDNGFITPNGRVGAMSGEANLNGAACAFGMAMLAYLHLSRSVTAWFAVPCAIAITWGLLMSASFTGFSATIIALIVMILATGPRGTLRIGAPLLLAASCYILLGGPMPEAFSERVFGALATGDLRIAGTFVERTQLIEEAWAILDDNLLVGLGFDGYRQASSLGMPVHNLFLLVTNEGGLLAIAGLFTLLAILFVWFVGTYRQYRLEGAVGLAVLGVFVIYAMAIPHMYTRMWTIPIFLCVALAAQTRSGPQPRTVAAS
jgi:hypothetical protein